MVALKTFQMPFDEMRNMSKEKRKTNIENKILYGLEIK